MPAEDVIYLAIIDDFLEKKFDFGEELLQDICKVFGEHNKVKSCVE